MAEGITFRDKALIAGKNGKQQRWIYPRIIEGRLYKYRSYLSYFLMLALFASPFIRLNDEQLVLLNVLERKFVFFGVVFMPQDFYIFVLASLTFLVFVILFTVVFGRVWCGWACPQTIFMEMLFRKIENWIEGDAARQKKLNASELTPEKFFKKTLKHSLFLLISFAIANTFLAYVIGSEALLKIIREPVQEHWAGFGSIIAFTLVFYSVFAYVREIVCTVICPYGRLQGVLLDNKSLVVAFDHKRGDPRGKRNRKVEDPNKGDCIDCGLCVQVCPTGIDIRNGTQLECINCTACIDACNMVMNKLNLPEGLIGFKSQEQLVSRQAFSFGNRIYGYAAILFLLTSVLTVLLVKRTDIETTILRASGTLYQERNDGTVSNLYNAELVNKTSHTINFQLKPVKSGAKIQFINRADSLKKGESIKLTFFVIQQKRSIKEYKSNIKLEVTSGEKLLDKIETTFIAPPNF